MNLYAIGDIHGYTKSLEALLRAVSPRPEDVVVFLGDYVDKGPDVAGTLELLVELAAANESWVFLRGNHDQMFIDARGDSKKYLMWECLSGKCSLESYGKGPTDVVFASIPESHFSFLEDRCMDFFETENFIFVHGGIRSDQKPADEDPERLLWSPLELALPHESGRTVICGHTSQLSGEIADRGHTICIDTGITKGNHITCLNLADFTYLQCDQNGGIRDGQLPSHPDRPSLNL